MRARAVMGCALAALAAGCQAPDWTGALGTAAGAAGGAALSHGSALGTAGGAVLGGLAGTSLSTSGKAAYQHGLDDGYLLGASDSVKRLYWSKQRLEQPAAAIEDPRAVLAAVVGPDGPASSSSR